MIERKLMIKLEEWRTRKSKKPLILRGARQVGKTTLIHQFSKNFDQYIYLNLETIEDKNIFLRNDLFEDLIEAIFYLKKKDKSRKNSLLFIDEIQNVPTAINQLRYFYEKMPELSVIAAGSLLETILDEKVRIPVGRTELMVLKPFSFEEFLWALEEKQSAELLCQIPVPEFAHQKLLKLFHRYTLIGGMPEVVARYVESRDVLNLNRIYDSLIAGYIDDVEKYANNKFLVPVIRHVILSSFQLSGTRIKFQNFGQSNYKSKEVKEALLVLEKALLIKLIRPTTSVKLPIISNYKKSPKLQFLDTGLINYYSGIQPDLFQTRTIDSIQEGRIAEHIIAQELLTLNESVLYNLNFWVREKKQSNAEVDFIYRYKNKLIPIEIKSGATGRLRSLHQFIDQTQHNIGVRLYSGKFSINNAITLKGKQFYLLNLPYFLATKIDKYLNFMENHYIQN